MEVIPVDRYIYDVRDGDKGGIVNLNTRTCTCRVFDLDQLPCAHALAVCGKIRFDYKVLCSHMYTTTAWVSTYAESIHPVGHQSDWIVPMDIGNRVVLPPVTKRPSGRPRSERIRSVGEHVVRKKCGRCHNYGHNRKTCKNAIPIGNAN